MSLVYLLVELVRRGEEVRLVHLNHVRDWIYAGDIVNASILLLELPNLKHHIYNVSGGRGYTHRQLIEELDRIIPVRYRQSVEEEANIPASITARRRGPMSIELLAADTGFSLTYELLEGLRRYVQWIGNDVSLGN
jgi:nucleoside-diphosphate-sugar epimerase